MPLPWFRATHSASESGAASEGEALSLPGRAAPLVTPCTRPTAKPKLQSIRVETRARLELDMLLWKSWKMLLHTHTHTDRHTHTHAHAHSLSRYPNPHTCSGCPAASGAVRSSLIQSSALAERARSERGASEELASPSTQPSADSSPL